MSTSRLMPQGGEERYYDPAGRASILCLLAFVSWPLSLGKASAAAIASSTGAAAAPARQGAEVGREHALTAGLATLGIVILVAVMGFRQAQAQNEWSWIARRIKLYHMKPPAPR